MKDKLFDSESYQKSVLLKLINDLKSQLYPTIVEEQLRYLEYYGNRLLRAIKESSSFEEAQDNFDILQEIQEFLSLLFFKYDVEVSSALEHFIRECDRLDDMELRRYIFKIIRNHPAPQLGDL